MSPSSKSIEIFVRNSFYVTEHLPSAPHLYSVYIYSLKDSVHVSAVYKKIGKFIVRAGWYFVALVMMWLLCILYIAILVMAVRRFTSSGRPSVISISTTYSFCQLNFKFMIVAPVFNYITVDEYNFIKINLYNFYKK